MADIAATDVTFTIKEQGRTAGPQHRKFNIVQLAFGDNTLLYPTGGIPLSATADTTNKDAGTTISRGSAKLGCPVVVERLQVLDQGVNAKGYKFEWDKANNKLLVFVSAGFTPAGTVPAHTHALHLNNADVADGATTRINAGTNLLGANTGTDISVAGVADTSGAGGIVNAAALALTGTAVAAAAPVQHANATFVPNPATLLVEVVGY